jgi:hypothetical protein
LKDPAVMAIKQKDEDDFKARIMANPQWQAAWGGAWNEISAAETKAVARLP